MQSMLRILTLCPRVQLADPLGSVEQILDRYAHTETAPDVVLLPRMALTAPSCGSLFGVDAILTAAETALDRLRLLTAETGSFWVVGLPRRVAGVVTAAIAVLHNGVLLGFLPDNDPPFGCECGEGADTLPADTVFSCGELRFSIATGKNLSVDAVAAAAQGVDLLLAPSYRPVVAGEISRRLSAAKSLSESLGIAIAVVNGGVGDTSSPFLYRGFSGIYEAGLTLGEQVAARESFSLAADLDGTVLHAQSRPRPQSLAAPFYAAHPTEGKRGLLRPVKPCPYLPESHTREYLQELFWLQVQGLADRLERTRISKLVLGISGGLDSTLAMLVAAKALDLLELPRKNLIAVTMPGFGTSDRTYFNALGLIEALGATGREIPIRAAVTQHFEDIGQNPAKHDLTYENAQARERTQILFDLGNMAGGLVVGTGDLSEAALGWCTFNGDQMAGYNVNICLPKTVIRLLVEELVSSHVLPGTEEYLQDVLDTPISPELLPADESGQIAQKTEDILGPYALHDFFLYYLVKYGFSPDKIYYYACVAFAGEFPPEYLREKLSLFLRRFVGGQFKRSAAPESAVITEVSLSSAVFRMPADLAASVLLSALPTITE